MDLVRTAENGTDKSLDRLVRAFDYDWKLLNSNDLTYMKPSPAPLKYWKIFFESQKKETISSFADIPQCEATVADAT